MSVSARRVDISSAERAVDRAFTTGKVDRAIITRRAREDAQHAIEMADIAIEADEAVDEATKLTIITSNMGNRDKTKRPEMAQIAVRGGDRAILTSDNPRGEDPNAILDDMVAGLEPTDRYLRIVDRREAIRTAVMLAEAGDVILVAGKGHETYQEVEGVKHHFDDREQVREAFDTLRTKR
jgi:UDP-N-acetylmuramoyl-L-alanyl-D-glutamate--2,6-diaminopimelate ligase